jgi:hypothetical protein
MVGVTVTVGVIVAVEVDVEVTVVVPVGGGAAVKLAVKTGAATTAFPPQPVSSNDATKKSRISFFMKGLENKGFSGSIPR